MSTEQKIFDFICKYYDEHGYQASFREIQSAIGIKSLQTVHRYMQVLFAKGYIETDLPGKKCGRAFRICKN